jgi:hypothetical protein
MHTARHVRYEYGVPDESKPEKLDRELNELLQGLRVLLPGVQVLFAFLLTVPFSDRFDQLVSSEKGFYLTALICAALASVLFAAPSTFHRILFRERDKEWLVVNSNRLAIAGTVLLAIAICCALFLVTEVIYGSRFATVVAGSLGLIFVVLWYVVPLSRRSTND